ncbi:sporulation integral membrane protein YtvI [Lysinibacillus piscis]|uniref:Sporulation integral membrane protein YtvI n=1 Tax=Lysinibacillus piscis TaxID=2518931 RepID=A0ABQ5NNC2_9BACI|nr:sporulation integral membrane protein YtvI [Lysinibacillus sp. KH24]GLC89494.1 sporulation integral membrane protein YtvI [Lysinibacillus sp. KH24]
MNKINTKKLLLRSFFIIAFLLAVYFIIPVSIPILVAGLTAFFLEPIVMFFKRRWKMSRRMAVTVIYTVSALIIAIVCYFTVTQLMAQIIFISKHSPYYISKLSLMWFNIQNNISQYTENLPHEVSISLQKTITDFIKTMEVSFLDFFNYARVTAFFSKIPSFFIDLLVYMIALFLFMLDLPKIKQLTYQYLKPNTANKLKLISSRLKDAFIGYWKAHLLVSVIIGIVTLIGLLLIQPKYAITLTIIIWLIDIVPFLGSIIILAPWGLYHLLVGNVGIAVKLFILAAILLIIRRVVEPKLMGEHIGLSTLPTLIAMFIGLQLFGVMGLLVGPFVIIFFIALKETGIIKFNFKI